MSNESAPMSVRNDGLFGIWSLETWSCAAIASSIRSRSSPWPACEKTRVWAGDRRNQISCPQLGHVPSPKKIDGSITTFASHSGHRADSPSGVRDEILIAVHFNSRLFVERHSNGEWYSYSMKSYSYSMKWSSYSYSFTIEIVLVLVLVHN